MEFDRLTPNDLEEALRLSTQAGWNQLPGDWMRVIDFAPEGCIAGRIGNRLVAASSVVSYAGKCGWIGMVLVDEAERGRGLGKALLTRTVERARELGIASFGLDATDLGRPVYLKLGFVDVAPIDRWGGVLKETVETGGATPLEPGILDSLIAWDRERCGQDRSGLLRHLLGEPDVAGWTVTDKGRLLGYAFLRPGREHAHLGPVVAEGGGALNAILNAAARHAAGKSLFIDALQTKANSAVLAAHGLEVRRTLTRMTFGRAERLLMGPGVVAATAFEWG